jgi:hypothetical protein
MIAEPIAEIGVGEEILRIGRVVFQLLAEAAHKRAQTFTECYVNHRSYEAVAGWLCGLANLVSRAE